MKRAWWFLLVSIVGCGFEAGLPAAAQITCTTDAECPAPLVCKTRVSRCGEPGGDEDPPTASVTVAAPARAGKEQTFSVTFTASEPLFAAPRVYLATPTRIEATVVEQAAQTYIATVVLGDVGDSGAWPLLVDMTDTSGNAALGASLGTVILDFVPPNVSAVQRQLFAGPENVLPGEQLVRVRDDASVALKLWTNEALSTAPTVSLACGDATFPLAFTLAASGNIMEATFTDIASLPEATCTLRGAFTDLAGNVAELDPIGTTQVIVDRTAPSAETLDLTLLKHLRAPYGAPQTGELVDGATPFVRGHWIVARDLASDAHPASLALPAAAFMGDEPLALVRFLDGPTGQGELGRLRVVSGDLAAVRLALIDAPEVWVEVVDTAGNGSERRRLPHGEVVTTLGGKVLGSNAANPHRLVVTSRDSGQRLPAQSREVIDPFVSPSVEHLGLSWARQGSPAFPPFRYDAAAATDLARGRLVFFGGQDDFGKRGDTWEWNGKVWREVSVVDSTGDGSPEQRSLHAMAFDAARGEVVLFGGIFDFSLRLNDTWTFDGTDWHNEGIAVDAPSPRSAASMAYDRVRERVVLFGGYDGMGYLAETWEWDGERWEEIAAADPEGDGNPSARGSAAMAFVGTRGRVTLVGGNSGGSCDGGGATCGVTWEWTGTSWERRCDDQPEGDTCTSPSVFRFGLGEDVGTGEIAFYSGYMAQRSHSLWRWNGQAWSEHTQPVESVASWPSSRFDAAGATDPATLSAAFVGGSYDGNWPYSCDGSDSGRCGGPLVALGERVALLPGVEAHDDNTAAPQAVTNAATTFDAARGEVLFFGGRVGSSNTSDLWAWDGVTYYRRSSIGDWPSARHSAAMTYDSERDVVLLFGGENLDGDCYEGAGSQCRSVWEWDGAEWTEHAPMGSWPDARRSALWVYDAERDVTLLVGGQAGGFCEGGTGTTCTGTWLWEDDAFVALDPEDTDIPWGLNRAAATYDASSGRVTVVSTPSGTAGPGLETFSFSGTAWEQHTDISCLPDGRRNHSLVYSQRLGRLVLFGGETPDSSQRGLQDLWSFDGTCWVRLTLGDSEADGQPTGRGGAALAEHPAAEQVILFGGSQKGGAALGDTWRMELGSDATPAAFLSVALAGLLPDAAVAEELSVRAWGNSSRDDSSAGVVVSAWLQSTYVELAGTGSAPQVTRVDDGPTLSRLLSPAEDTMSFRVTAEATGPGAELRVEGFEVGVIYDVLEAAP